MRAVINYFGMLADATRKPIEVLELEKDTTVSKLMAIVEKKYRQFKAIKYKVVVNHRVINDFNKPLDENAEIAFLPPFAGG